MYVAPAETERRVALFLRAYAEHGDATRAYVQAGYAKRGASRRVHAWMAKHDVEDRARAARDKAATAAADAFALQQKELRDAATDAIASLRALVKGQKPEGCDARAGFVGMVAAITAVLDRAGHKPVEHIEQRVEFAEVERQLAGIDWRTSAVDECLRLTVVPPAPAPTQN